MVTFVTLFQNISFFLSKVIALFLFFVIASIVSSRCALDFAFNLRQLSEFVLSSWGSPAFHTDIEDMTNQTTVGVFLLYFLHWDQNTPFILCVWDTRCHHFSQPPLFSTNWTLTVISSLFCALCEMLASNTKHRLTLTGYCGLAHLSLL